MKSDLADRKAHFVTAMVWDGPAYVLVPDVIKAIATRISELCPHGNTRIYTNLDDGGWEIAVNTKSDQNGHWCETLILGFHGFNHQNMQLLLERINKDCEILVVGTGSLADGCAFNNIMNLIGSYCHTHN